MNTNDPRREPEPTDAELICEMAKVQAVHTLTGNGRPTLLHNQIVKICDRGREYLSGARPMPQVAWGIDPALPNADYTAGYCTKCNTPVYHRLGKPGEYDHECLMPDTPAPDEVAQLDCGDNSCQYATRKGGQGTNGGCRCLAELPSGKRLAVARYIHGLKSANTTLTARVADLERENAALGAEVARLDGSTCSAQEQAGDGPCGNCPRCVLENIMAGLGHQIETLNKRVAYLADALLPATGKEPTDV